MRDLRAVRERLAAAPTRAETRRAAPLPVPRTSLVGRQGEVASVRQLLEGNARLVTITGPGGIGKTRIAIQIAHEVGSQFPGGVFFVPLAAISDPDLVAASIARAPGVVESGARPLTDLIKDHLRGVTDAQTLLVIDNFEHLASAAPLVAELLSDCPGLRVVVTSRTRLKLYGEQELVVQPLAGPDVRTSVASVARAPAVALFVERAAALKPGFAVTPENAPALVDICEQLDGVPLAIELAAARVKTLTPQALLSRLSGRLQLLTTGAQDAAPRQQTLRAAIDWSYNLLTEPEQNLFRRLSVFVGGFTLDGAEAVCDATTDLGGDVLDLTASLVDKSLLQQLDLAGDDARFRMLKTIRDYAQERLESSSEAESIRRAHAAYCIVLAEEGSEELRGPQGVSWRQRFDVEQNNFRAALDWLLQARHADWGIRLGLALFPYWELADHLSEGSERLAALVALEPNAQTASRARAMHCLGVLNHPQRRFESSRPYFEEAVAIYRVLGDRQGLAVVLNALGICYLSLDFNQRSAETLEEVAAIWRELGDQANVARTLTNLANTLERAGEHHRASAVIQDALTIFRQTGDAVGEGWTLSYAGDAARDRGETERATELYGSALELFRRVGDRHGVAAGLADIGRLARQGGDYTRAHTLNVEALTLFHELGQMRSVARLLESMAIAAGGQQQSVRALTLAGAAASIRQVTGTVVAEADRIKLDEAIAAARGRLDRHPATVAWLEGWTMPEETAVAFATTESD